MTTNGEKKALKSIFVATLVIIVLFFVSSYFLSMLLGPTLFFFTPEGLTMSKQHYPLPILLFFIIGFYTPFGLNYGLVFVFVWGVYAVCFIAAWKFRESLHEVIRKGFSRPTKKLFNNCLFTMPIIASMMLTAVVAIQTFQEAHGVPTGEPPLPEPPFEAFFWLTYAPLVEEVGFRVSPIGAFLIVYLFLAGKRKKATFSRGQRLEIFLLAPLYPEKAKRLLGVKTVNDFGFRGGINPAEWIMIIFTSVAFGLAHHFFGGGWEVGKITSASVVGLAMGLTYLLYGVQAPILLHWFFNYYFSSFDLASRFYPNMIPIFSSVWVTTVTLGLLGWLVVTILGISRIAKAIAKRTKPSNV